MKIEWIILILCLGIRFFLAYEEKNQIKKKKKYSKDACAFSQTNGNQEIQSDSAKVITTQAGYLAVLADGIGKRKIGRVCAEQAVWTFEELYRSYRTIDKSEYFLKRAFAAANQKVAILLESRQGGASVAAAFINRTHLTYAVAGDVKVVMIRNGELIPLSDGQTIDMLARQAYQKGKFTREKALWSAKEEKVWNYLGKEGFGEVEILEIPIKLKTGDVILLMSKGIYQSVSAIRIEDIAKNPSLTGKEKADIIVMEAEKQEQEDKENGSVIVIDTNGWM